MLQKTFIERFLSFEQLELEPIEKQTCFRIFIIKVFESLFSK